MGNIIYRIIFPGIVLAVVFIAIVSRYLCKNRNKKQNVANNHFFTIFCIILSLLGLSMSIFYSFDLLYKDFIVSEGIFVNYHREKDEYELLFANETNGTDIRCYIPITEIKKYDFSEDSIYKVTYARRTGMLIDATETGNCNADDQICEESQKGNPKTVRKVEQGSAKSGVVCD